MYSAARLSVCPVVLQISRARHARYTDILLRTSREDPRSILVRHVRHARFPRDMLATSSPRCHQGCYEETASVERAYDDVLSVSLRQPHPSDLTFEREFWKKNFQCKRGLQSP